MKKYYFLLLIVFQVSGYAQADNPQAAARGGGEPDCEIYILSQPTELSVCNGQPAAFYISATGPIISYQWVHNETYVGGNSDSYMISEVTPEDAGDYYCIITGGCWSMYSEHKQLSVNMPPEITLQPAPDTILCPGYGFSLSVSTPSINATYAWYHNNIPVENVAESTINVPNAHYGDGGEYYCIVTDSGCSSTSSVAFVNQVIPPTLTAQTYTDGQTLADVVVNGANVLWYASFEDSIVNQNILPLSTVLVEGTSYYVTQSIDGCESLPEVLTVQFLGVPTFEISGVFYPNPVKDFLFFESDSALTSVTVYDVLGQRIFSEPINGVSGKVDVSALGAGPYVAVVASEKGRKSVKFVKR